MVAACKHLGNDEDVGGQSALQHDWHVRGVEQSDWVQAVRASLSCGFDRKLDLERLQVNHGKEDQDSDNHLEHVSGVVSVEGLDQRSSLGLLSEKKMDKSQNGTFKFCSTSPVDGGWSETSPENLFADIGGHEQRNSRTETVAFLQQLVQKNNHHGSKHKLQNQQQAHAGAQITWTAIHSCQNVHGCLSHREQNGKDFLGNLQQFAVLFVFHVDSEQLCALQELENHARGDNWRNTQLH
ncbi:hypothetical protein OGATHE_002089 [Ogataea polymorpha]|uniref:Uncharacterized protein n=1 Tax=Ogataea polymorpha TaxID=460523 RepID=A0A9P8PMG7_9ASCO|nr:hypothetical protein OGATHE_002089 [Ogataea polymorpha]